MPRQAHGSSVTLTDSGWRLTLPAGPSSNYRLAQLDDYFGQSRARLPHTPPRTLSLRLRLSAPDLPGTWGFGLWNDPFGFSLGFGTQAARLPALPQAAWFMHASPPNWLSFQDGLPASGFFAGTYRSLAIPSLLLAPALLAYPLCAIRPISRVLRRLTAHLVRQNAVRVTLDVTQWHTYDLHWSGAGCTFSVDGVNILSTPICPHPPLGLVIWIDNQYAFWTPEGRLGYGTLENQLAWLEVENLVAMSA